MGYEVEVKYRVADLESVARRLTDRGATPRDPIEQTDVYLAHPSRDFAATNEAFRIRREGGSNKITYKGPKLAGPTKTREEFEIEFASGSESFEMLATLLDRLGFRTVAAVLKTRRPFHLVYEGREIDVCLDVAKDIGEFVEVETLAPAPEDLPAARSAVLNLSGELNLVEVEPRSYLRMLLERSTAGG